MTKTMTRYLKPGTTPVNILFFEVGLLLEGKEWEISKWVLERCAPWKRRGLQDVVPANRPDILKEVLAFIEAYGPVQVWFEVDKDNPQIPVTTRLIAVNDDSMYIVGFEENPNDNPNFWDTFAKKSRPVNYVRVGRDDMEELYDFRGDGNQF